ncbi:MAG: DNA-directed RNA polymerase subunit alpha [Patescibacteria group bacterium]|nr:DNA-directed RNA polymerase subunit alpha [Patescibacteria group bacterium]
MLTYKDLLDKVQLKTVEQKKDFGRFVFEPLPVGFGHTLGSVLRRTLLSSIPGAAVTQVKIDGATHPFTTLPGVREDVVDLLLNIKKIRLKIFNNQPVILKLDHSGTGEIKAGDLEVVGDGEVVNTGLLLATLTDKKSKLSMELTAESGVGYESAEEHAVNKVGVIPLDSVFSPVTEVSYRVGLARFGQETTLDSLEVEIKTDGTVVPSEALKTASTILQDFFAAFSHEKEEEALTSAAEKPEDKGSSLGEQELGVALEDLGLSTRTTNALLKAKIKNLGELVSKKDELSKIKGLGQKGIGEILELLKKQDWK